MMKTRITFVRPKLPPYPSKIELKKNITEYFLNILEICEVDKKYIDNISVGQTITFYMFVIMLNTTDKRLIARITNTLDNSEIMYHKIIDNSPKLYSTTTSIFSQKFKFNSSEPFQHIGVSAL